jgi:hypothetical protein
MLSWLSCRKSLGTILPGSRDRPGKLYYGLRNYVRMPFNLRGPNSFLIGGRDDSRNTKVKTSSNQAQTNQWGPFLLVILVGNKKKTVDSV